MQIEYKRYARFGSDSTIVKESIEWWFRKNLERDGIESQIEKMRQLITIMGEQFLLSHPQQLNEISTAIGCEGYDHEIT